jgi:capsular polysaccharide biosynthesis protein
MNIFRLFRDRSKWGETDHYLVFVARLARELRRHGFRFVQTYQNPKVGDICAHYGEVPFGFFCQLNLVTMSLIHDVQEAQITKCEGGRRLIVVTREPPDSSIIDYARAKGLIICHYKVLFSAMAAICNMDAAAHFHDGIAANIVMETQFHPQSPNKQIAAASQLSLEPIELMAADFAEDWLVSWHRSNAAAAVHELGCYYLPQLVVSGPGILTMNGAVLDSPEFTPSYVRRRYGYGAMSHDLERLIKLPRRDVTGPCVVLAGWGVRVYGHFLIEMLFRLLIAKRTIVESRFDRCTFLVDSRVPAWLTQLLSAYLGVSADRVEPFVSSEEAIRIRLAVLPTLPSHDGIFHPFANQIIEDLIASLGVRAGDTDRIFVSRSMLGQTNSICRRCANVEEIETIACNEFGFHLFNPETECWKTQIGVMMGAKIIAGEYGSGLHNALFAPSATKVAAIGTLNLEQSHIGTLRQHRNAYFSVNLEQNEYRVDQERFRRFLDAVIKA